MGHDDDDDDDIDHASMDHSKHKIFYTRNENTSVAVDKIPGCMVNKSKDCNRRSASMSRGGNPGRSNPLTTMDRGPYQQNGPPDYP